MKKVLVIEDDVFLGDVLVEKLKQEGFEPYLSRDGKEGLDKIKEVKPDLVLLDIILPSMNGYEILEAKQKDGEIKSVPVIIISNSGQPVEINRALALGVKDYFVKAQFDPAEVMTKVRNFLNNNKEEVSESDTPSAIPASLNGKKIMWVEDDPLLSEIIARKLAAQNCTLVYSKDADEALNLVESEKPDIILLDVLLPGMNGFQFLEKVKANPKVKDIPVVLLSNLGQDSDIEKGKALGAVHYLIKASYTLDDILVKIADVLEKNKK